MRKPTNQKTENGILRSRCDYCGRVRQIKLWDETGEFVCLECRQGLLEQEFKEAGFNWAVELADTESEEK